jgi:hypothetical protein
VAWKVSIAHKTAVDAAEISDQVQASVWIEFKYGAVMRGDGRISAYVSAYEQFSKKSLAAGGEE